MSETRKRKLNTDATVPSKKMKMTTKGGTSSSPTSGANVIEHAQPAEPAAADVQKLPPQEEQLENSGADQTQTKQKGKQKRKERPRDVQPSSRRRINKLKPPRPFPTVPTSVSATGPRSAHREGKDMICITRQTSLGAYMRRCKKVIIEDGYKTLHLSAMGAAIPLLVQLVCALPPILPFSQDEIHWEVTTGTVEVQDEVIPEDEEEDLSYQTRCKSNLAVIFKIGDGKFEGDRNAVRRYSAGKHVPKTKPIVKLQKGNGKEDTKGKRKAAEEVTELVYEEPEQEFMDLL